MGGSRKKKRNSEESKSEREKEKTRMKERIDGGENIKGFFLFLFHFLSFIKEGKIGKKVRRKSGRGRERKKEKEWRKKSLHFLFSNYFSLDSFVHSLKISSPPLRRKKRREERKE